jgi:hypothetical protein
VIGVSIVPGPVYGRKTVALGLPEWAGIVIPESPLVAWASWEDVESSVDSSVDCVSIITVPGSPEAVGGTYLVTGSVIEPGPG